MKLPRLLIPILLVSLAVAIAGNWDQRHPASPASLPRPVKPIRIPAVSAGHVAIQNGTDAPMGFMIFPAHGAVICPELPPSFGTACIEVAAHGNVDYTVVRTEAQR